MSFIAHLQLILIISRWSDLNEDNENKKTITEKECIWQIEILSCFTKSGQLYDMINKIGNLQITKAITTECFIVLMV